MFNLGHYVKLFLVWQAFILLDVLLVAIVSGILWGESVDSFYQSAALYAVISFALVKAKEVMA